VSKDNQETPQSKELLDQWVEKDRARKVQGT
jgi:hypothetical protein